MRRKNPAQSIILPSLLILILAPVASYALDYAIGADLSFLKQAEDRGAVFKDQGEAKPGLQIFKDHGYNWIRLRLFHTPTRLPNNLDYTIALAQNAKKLGYKFLLNYHYSDIWAVAACLTNRATRFPSSACSTNTRDIDEAHA